MQKTKKNACESCGFVKAPQPIDLEKEMYCGLCDEKFPKKDSKEHKKKNTHIIKNDIIKKVKELKPSDEADKKTINNIFKTLTPKYIKNKLNKNTLE
jgi:hypothetical protein